MENVKYVYQGTEKSGTSEHEMVCYANAKGELFLEIKMDEFESSFICLNRDIANVFLMNLQEEIKSLEV